MLKLKRRRWTLFAIDKLTSRAHELFDLLEGTIQHLSTLPPKAKARANPCRDIRVKEAEAKAALVEASGEGGASSSSQRTGQPDAAEETAKQRRFRELAESKEDIKVKISQKFSAVNPDQWVTLPSNRGPSSWMTRAACGILKT